MVLSNHVLRSVWVYRFENTGMVEISDKIEPKFG